MNDELDRQRAEELDREVDKAIDEADYIVEDDDENEQM